MEILWIQSHWNFKELINRKGWQVNACQNLFLTIYNYLGFSDDINKLSEAEILNIILKSKYDLIPSFLEINSKNAGENVSYLFDLLSSKNIEVKNLILIQDSPFQLRLNATFKHYDGKIKILNFAPYKSHFSFDFHSCSIINIGSNGSPWSVKELASLYIGEFERVYDGIAGYGPKGLNYIAHIDVPENVVNAFHNVKSWISTEVVVENIWGHEPFVNKVLKLTVL